MIISNNIKHMINIICNSAIKYTEDNPPTKNLNQ